MSQSIQEQAEKVSYAAAKSFADNHIDSNAYEQELQIEAHCAGQIVGFYAGASSLQGEVERLRKALEDIKKHQEIIGGDISRMGTIWHIATDALNK